MEIYQMPILSDNYSHLLIDRESGTVAAIDPAEPGRLIPWLQSEGLTLSHILCTHHHWDHAGGNEELLDTYPDAEVYAGEVDAAKVFGVTSAVNGGDCFSLQGYEVRVLGVPCHTRGHVAYLIEDNLFCGDTLFVAGCGRFFEGEASEMHEALNGVFGALPDGTKVYCGHEYTVSNLQFAVSIEPQNEAAKTKLDWAIRQREEGLSTVPSTLKEERSFNPFMRVDQPSVSRAVNEQDPVLVMRALRDRKNQFRPPAS